MSKICESKKEAKAEHKAVKKLAKLEKAGKKQKKVEKVMHEFKEHELHSGSKKGPVVNNPKQAIAIALHEAGIKRKKKKNK